MEKDCKKCIHYDLCKDLAETLEMEECICNHHFHFKDKSRNIELPKGVNFIHSERLIYPLRPGDEYEWQSIYRLTLYVAGKSTSLESARHLMNNADEEFLKRTNIPYKEEGEI